MRKLLLASSVLVSILSPEFNPNAYATMRQMNATIDLGTTNTMKTIGQESSPIIKHNSEAKPVQITKPNVSFLKQQDLKLKNYRDFNKKEIRRFLNGAEKTVTLMGMSENYMLRTIAHSFEGLAGQVIAAVDDKFDTVFCSFKAICDDREDLDAIAKANLEKILQYIKDKDPKVFEKLTGLTQVQAVKFNEESIRAYNEEQVKGSFEAIAQESRPKFIPDDIFDLNCGPIKPRFTAQSVKEKGAGGKFQEYNKAEIRRLLHTKSSVNLRFEKDGCEEIVTVSNARALAPLIVEKANAGDTGVFCALKDVYEEGDELYYAPGYRASKDKWQHDMRMILGGVQTRNQELYSILTESKRAEEFKNEFQQLIKHNSEAKPVQITQPNVSSLNQQDLRLKNYRDLNREGIRLFLNGARKTVILRGMLEDYKLRATLAHSFEEFAGQVIAAVDDKVDAVFCSFKAIYDDRNNLEATAKENLEKILQYIKDKDPKVFEKLTGLTQVQAAEAKPKPVQAPKIKNAPSCPADSELEEYRNFNKLTIKRLLSDPVNFPGCLRKMSESYKKRWVPARRLEELAGQIIAAADDKVDLVFCSFKAIYDDRNNLEATAKENLEKTLQHIKDKDPKVFEKLTGLTQVQAAEAKPKPVQDPKIKNTPSCPADSELEKYRNFNKLAIKRLLFPVNSPERLYKMSEDYMLRATPARSLEELTDQIIAAVDDKVDLIFCSFRAICDDREDLTQEEKENLEKILQYIKDKDSKAFKKLTGLIQAQAVKTKSKPVQAPKIKNAPSRPSDSELEKYRNFNKLAIKRLLSDPVTPPKRLYKMSESYKRREVPARSFEEFAAKIIAAVDDKVDVVFCSFKAIYDDRNNLEATAKENLEKILQYIKDKDPKVFEKLEGSTQAQAVKFNEEAIRAYNEEQVKGSFETNRPVVWKHILKDNEKLRIFALGKVQERREYHKKQIISYFKDLRTYYRETASKTMKPLVFNNGLGASKTDGAKVGELDHLAALIISDAKSGINQHNGLFYAFKLLYNEYNDFQENGTIIEEKVPAINFRGNWGGRYYDLFLKSESKVNDKFIERIMRKNYGMGILSPLSVLCGKGRFDDNVLVENLKILAVAIKTLDPDLYKRIGEPDYATDLELEGRRSYNEAQIRKFCNNTNKPVVLRRILTDVKNDNYTENIYDNVSIYETFQLAQMIAFDVNVNNGMNELFYSFKQVYDGRNTEKNDVRWETENILYWMQQVDPNICKKLVNPFQITEIASADRRAYNEAQLTKFLNSTRSYLLLRCALNNKYYDSLENMYNTIEVNGIEKLVKLMLVDPQNKTKELFGIFKSLCNKFDKLNAKEQENILLILDTMEAQYPSIYEMLMEPVETSKIGVASQSGYKADAIHSAKRKVRSVPEIMQMSRNAYNSNQIKKFLNTGEPVVLYRILNDTMDDSYVENISEVKIDRPSALANLIISDDYSGVHELFYSFKSIYNEFEDSNSSSLNFKELRRMNATLHWINKQNSDVYRRLHASILTTEIKDTVLRFMNRQANDSKAQQRQMYNKEHINLFLRFYGTCDAVLKLRLKNFDKDLVFRPRCSGIKQYELLADMVVADANNGMNELFYAFKDCYEGRDSMVYPEERNALKLTLEYIEKRDETIYKKIIAPSQTLEDMVRQNLVYNAESLSRRWLRGFDASIKCLDASIIGPYIKNYRYPSKVLTHIFETNDPLGTVAFAVQGDRLGLNELFWAVRLMYQSWQQIDDWVNMAENKKCPLDPIDVIYRHGELRHVIEGYLREKKPDLYDRLLIPVQATEIGVKEYRKYNEIQIREFCNDTNKSVLLKRILPYKMKADYKKIISKEDDIFKRLGAEDEGFYVNKYGRLAEQIVSDTQINSFNVIYELFYSFKTVCEEWDKLTSDGQKNLNEILLNVRQYDENVYNKLIEPIQATEIGVKECRKYNEIQIREFCNNTSKTVVLKCILNDKLADNDKNFYINISIDRYTTLANLILTEVHNELGELLYSLKAVYDTRNTLTSQGKSKMNSLLCWIKIQDQKIYENIVSTQVTKSEREKCIEYNKIQLRQFLNTGQAINLKHILIDTQTGILENIPLDNMEMIATQIISDIHKGMDELFCSFKSIYGERDTLNPYERFGLCVILGIMNSQDPALYNILMESTKANIIRQGEINPVQTVEVDIGSSSFRKQLDDYRKYNQCQMNDFLSMNGDFSFILQKISEKNYKMQMNIVSSFEDLADQIIAAADDKFDTVFCSFKAVYDDRYNFDPTQNANLRKILQHIKDKDRKIFEKLDGSSQVARTVEEIRDYEIRAYNEEQMRNFINTGIPVDFKYIVNGNGPLEKLILKNTDQLIAQMVSDARNGRYELFNSLKAIYDNLDRFDKFKKKRIIEFANKISDRVPDLDKRLKGLTQAQAANVNEEEIREYNEEQMRNLISGRYPISVGFKYIVNGNGPLEKLIVKNDSQLIAQVVSDARNGRYELFNSFKAVYDKFDESDTSRKKRIVSVADEIKRQAPDLYKRLIRLTPVEAENVNEEEIRAYNEEVMRYFISGTSFSETSCPIFKLIRVLDNKANDGGQGSGKDCEYFYPRFCNNIAPQIVSDAKNGRYELFNSFKAIYDKFDAFDERSQINLTKLANDIKCQDQALYERLTGSSQVQAVKAKPKPVQVAKAPADASSRSAIKLPSTSLKLSPRPGQTAKAQADASSRSAIKLPSTSLKFPSKPKLIE